MPSLRLYKKEKLTGDIAIASLFNAAGADDVNSYLAYPLKAVWRHNPRRHNDAPVRFLVSIPKRRIRHAVDRVTLRRRVREAFRLNRPYAPPVAAGSGESQQHTHKSDSPAPYTRLDLALIYVADSPQPYRRIQQAMRRIFKAMAAPAGDVTP